jgi:thiamine pyrophosphokinase
MSSHHIVREKQEPALIIANGEACSSELLGQLLEWSPTVIVLDGALERVLELGIKIDVVMGDFDTRNPTELLAAQFPVKILHTPDQEYTDLEKGIHYLIQEEYPAANILWATGRRADHTFCNIALLCRYAKDISLKIIDDYSCIFPILPRPHYFKKWYKKGTILSLIPLGKTTGITTQNLLYNLQDSYLQLGYRNGNSNEVLEDGVVSVEYAEGDMLIMECND